MKNICQEILSITYLLTMLILNSCDTAEPQPANFHNKILFTSSRSGKEQLYMMNPDGTNIRQLTSGQYWHNNGRWSPDAQKIVCNTEEGTSTAGFEMVVMNSDGSNRKLLGYGNQMSWYPDGSKIIFSYWQGEEVGIYNNNLFSSDPEGKNRIVISEKYVGNHTFSPDGSKIAFTVKPDSLTRIVILNYPQFDNPVYVGPPVAIYPNYSPDGNDFAFSKRENKNMQHDIYLMNTNGFNIRRVTNNISEMPYVRPQWFPEGDKIIFLAHTIDDTQKWYLYMVNKDGTDLHKIINDDSITSCDWSK